MKRALRVFDSCNFQQMGINQSHSVLSFFFIDDKLFSVCYCYSTITMFAKRICKHNFYGYSYRKTDITFNNLVSSYISKIYFIYNHIQRQFSAKVILQVSYKLKYILMVPLIHLYKSGKVIYFSNTQYSCPSDAVLILFTAFCHN